MLAGLAAVSEADLAEAGSVAEEILEVEVSAAEVAGSVEGELREAGD